MKTISTRKYNLLVAEARRIQEFLEGFEPSINGERRIAQMGKGAEHIYVRNFPLPDGYSPDYIDLMLLLDDFPARPPIGIYVLHRNNAALISQISMRINAFRDAAYHSAPTIRNYTWICYSYEDNNWRFMANNPAQGDNTVKFLAGFFAELC